MVPLETAPLYAADSYPNRYWTAVRNTTEWSVFMRELTTSGNALSKLMLEALAPKLHGAHLGEPRSAPSWTERLTWTPFAPRKRLPSPAYRTVRLARLVLRHLRPASGLPQRHRAAERHGRRAFVRVPAEREHRRPGCVYRRRGDRPGQLLVVSGRPATRRGERKRVGLD